MSAVAWRVLCGVELLPQRGSLRRLVLGELCSDWINAAVMGVAWLAGRFDLVLASGGTWGTQGIFWLWVVHGALA